MRNEPQRSGEAEQFATRGAAGGEQSEYSARGGTTLSEAGKRWNTKQRDERSDSQRSGEAV